jgi:hypothetical protein
VPLFFAAVRKENQLNLQVTSKKNLHIGRFRLQLSGCYLPIALASGQKEGVNPPLADCSPEPDTPMPRYYFNTRVGDELIADPEGEELRDPDRAWEIARAMIRELLKTEGAEAGLLKATLEVTDDAGEIVLEFPFTEAILDFSDAPATRH